MSYTTEDRAKTVANCLLLGTAIGGGPICSLSNTYVAFSSRIGAGNLSFEITPTHSVLKTHIPSLQLHDSSTTRIVPGLLAQVREQQIAYFLDAIASFTEMDIDWNSHGSNPIPKSVAALASNALRTLQANYLFPNQVTPTGNESIVFEAYKNGVKYLFEFCEDNEIAILIKSNGRQKLLDTTASEFEKVIEDLENAV